MRFVIITLLLILGYTAHALDEPVSIPFRLHGRLLSHADSTAISNAHVINLSTARGTTTAPDGRFGLWVSEGDKIRFQVVGYVAMTITVEARPALVSDSLDFYLEEIVIQLPVVTIFPYATFAEFKHAFINFKDPEPEYSYAMPELTFEPSLENRPPGFGIVIPGPITALYDQFSRRGRELRTYQRVLQEEELAKRAARIVNPSVIKQLTGIDNEQTYYAFLRFCNLSNDYIAAAKAYEVYEQLLRCHEQFASLEE